MTYPVDLGIGGLDDDDLDYIDFLFDVNDDSHANTVNDTIEESSPYSCTISNLLQSSYGTVINVVLMVYMSAVQDRVTMGDLLQFSHDNVNTYFQNEEFGYPDLTEPVMPGWLSSTLPDEMHAILENGPNNLSADEIGKYANHDSFGISAIDDEFLFPLEYSSKCRNAKDVYDIEYYTCRDEMFHSDLAQALKVLKYTMQAAHSRIHPKEQASEDFRLAQNVANGKYSKRKKRNFNKVHKCLQFDPAVRYCYFGKKEDDIFKRSLQKDDCILFHRTFGIKGISYEFNPAQEFWDLYSVKNIYSRMIYNEIFQEDTFFVNKSNDALNSDKVLDFFIYPDSLEKCCMEEMTPPEIAIHHPTKIPNSYLKLQRGYRFYFQTKIFLSNEYLPFIVIQRYTLTVTPSNIIMTDDDLIDIPEDKRKCRFSNEHHNNDKSLFKNYSQSSCLFECALQKSLENPDKPNCLPWDLPHPEENITVCHGIDDYLEEYPLDTKQADECDCPFDCNVLGYTYTWNREPLTGVLQCV